MKLFNLFNLVNLVISSFTPVLIPVHFHVAWEPKPDRNVWWDNIEESNNAFWSCQIYESSIASSN